MSFASFSIMRVWHSRRLGVPVLPAMSAAKMGLTKPNKMLSRP